MHKIILDENIPLSLRNDLERLGYEVVHIGEVNGGVSDDEVLRICYKENAILITQDRDFGTLLYFKQSSHIPYALILIRYTTYENRGVLKEKVIGILLDILQGCYYTIDTNSIRKRLMSL